MKKIPDPSAFTTTMPWLKDRGDISSNENRFGLPMNLLDLEKMTPMKYLRKYCFISKQSDAVYRFKFIKLTNKNKPKVTFDELCSVLKNKLCNEIDMTDVRSLLTLLDVCCPENEFSYLVSNTL